MFFELTSSVRFLLYTVKLTEIVSELFWIENCNHFGRMVHTQAKEHCEKQRRSRIVRSSAWMCDLGYTMKLVLVIDAKATEDILHRQGLGRMKHIDVAHLCLQDEVRLSSVTVRRVKKLGQCGGLGHQGCRSSGGREACRNPRIHQHAAQPTRQQWKQ